MRLRRTSRRPEAEINIAPLIDVVFLLIIFSMVVSQFTKVQSEEIELPEASQGDAADLAPAPRLIVNVSADGNVVVDGRPVAPAELDTLLAGLGPDPEVVIRGDRATAWRTVRRIMQACAARGISKVKVAVTEPEGP